MDPTMFVRVKIYQMIKLLDIYINQDGFFRGDYWEGINTLATKTMQLNNNS